MAVKNIIFDLGGVLLNIDFKKTAEAFGQYGFGDFSDYYQQAFSSPFFSSFEQGNISPEEFYEGIRKISSSNLSNEQIKNAWNALLLDFRKGSIQYLESLQAKLPVFLLSNTNAVHYTHFAGKFFEEYQYSFDELFTHPYYSHVLHMVKPGPEPYLHILQEHGLAAEETLFIDDTIKNIEGAQAVGLQALFLQKGMLIEEELPKILG